MSELLVVATPIGNLQDLSPRAAEALSRADLIAAEDTRVTVKLLNHLSLKKPMVSCHRHNEGMRADALVKRMLEEDLVVALTSDAGTPCISDPGQELVASARAANIPVIPVCGPSAVTAALSVSGFNASCFAFYGFLPREKKPLREKLKEILQTGIPVSVFYESPYRLVSLVREIAEAWPGSALCVCSDISKRFERAFVGPCEEVYEAVRSDANIEKGEYCVIADLSKVSPPKAEEAKLSAEMFFMSCLLEGDAFEDAAKRAAELYSRNEVYRARLKIREMLMEHGDGLMD